MGTAAHHFFKLPEDKKLRLLLPYTRFYWVFAN